MAALRGSPINQGGPNNVNGYAAGYMWSYFNAPVGRPTGQGHRYIEYRAIGFYVAGSGANRNLQFFISNADTSGYAGTGILTAGSGGGDSFSAGNISLFSEAQGQLMRAGWDNVSGTLNFGRYQPGTAYGEYGNYDGNLVGSVNYAECPSAPNLYKVQPDAGGRVIVGFDGSTVDDGGSPITQWTLQWSTHPNFATNTQQKLSNGADVLYLTPGVTYYFRAAGHNRVTWGFGGGLGESGQFSNVRSATMIGGGKIRRNGLWVPANAKIRDGGAWKAAKVKVRSGGAWVDAN